MNLSKKYAIGLLSVGLLGMVAIPVSAITTIDFELGAPTLFINQTPLTNEFSGLGVNFSGDGEVLNMSTFTFGARSGTDAIAFNDGVPVTGPETILFDSDVSSVSIYGAIAGGASIMMEAFDVGNSSLGSTFISPGLNYTELRLSGIGNIRSVVISSVGIWALDDLSFEQINNNQAIPEPVTATLGLMGLGVLGMMTRRRTTV